MGSPRSPSTSPSAARSTIAWPCRAPRSASGRRPAPTDSETVPCACPDCVCEVAPGHGIARAGKTFCCEDCAAGHPDHAGCGHSGCACHG
ncbi:metallothionein [Methylobacterium sp. WL116]|uniref:metallothionein n=1 Tax=Methylobacterium sp. WL116 TaxID=2603889 RepID=UPI001FF05FBE|nr:metallothionein [Methylobacterium sp. WL116]